MSVTPFAWPVRVYYEDTDSGGVVYYANYLRFLERARTEWLRQHGFEQSVLVEQQGIIFVVRRVLVEYLRPARFNDLLEVGVVLAETGRASLVFEQCITSGGERLVEARVTVACVQSETFRPVAIPALIKQAISTP